MAINRSSSSTSALASNRGPSNSSTSHSRSNATTTGKRRGIISQNSKPKKPAPRQGYYGRPKCPIGTMFASRKECSVAGVHYPLIAGISCSTSASRSDIDPGAFSIVLSGGYEDDVDDGYTILYTGAGGQSNTSVEPTTSTSTTHQPGSQVENQSIKHYFNHALRLNLQTEHPVRVVRGFKNKSEWAPTEGYRYDGLYRVVKCKIIIGKSGHQVCLFQLERLPNQRPLEDLPKSLSD
ncbi:hypothetical protein P691DRAFT_736533 [Macrolepiota fuliginosa MF-IS2]|uniref:YDG domain-containing protein n=1 Tax=Macrolepiota fuliginosa MF-IS2 TaxID=1400762 RepID=A0A9P5X6R5_9AGAR|nr:hypothetical protein P691DRAFT_736533 [Macrolepiota fuliginosa MF-IS2]